MNLNILMPIDGTDDCKKTLQVLKNMYNPETTQVTLMYVNTTLLYAGADLSEDKIRRSKLKSQGMLDDAAEFIAEFKPTEFYTVGYACEQILKKSKENFDLIIMSKRGQSALNRILLGSVTSKVVHNSAVSVLVVPR
ncbi:universal stress protein [Colwellia ponticola]|uniref:Universal stress protein n=1 Tax=Colwellia ponticola TaxID=2304625 RepID=A0A8H2JNS2_9GAMM|nr:universal stress protein [Colwellia ponticola]TMM47001.1 universal stress protein [Colwellia ponticola]